MYRTLLSKNIQHKKTAQKPRFKWFQFLRVYNIVHHSSFPCTTVTHSLHWTTRQPHRGYVKYVTNMAMHYVIAHIELTSLIYTTFDNAHGHEITCSSLDIADLTIKVTIMG